jgi:Asp-tRNA(Asn)/Glu-tRNA(Gln) amidotransferase A subunit family amidase
VFKQKHASSIERVTEPIERAVTKAATILADAGVVVEHRRPTGIERTERLLQDFGNDGAAWVRRLLARSGTSTADVSPAIKAWLASKTDSAGDLTASVEAMDQYKSDMLSFMHEYDAVLCPVEAYAAMSERRCSNAITRRPTRSRSISRTSRRQSFA